MILNRSFFGFIAAFFLISGASPAQDLIVSPKLRAGDTFTVEVVHIREDSARPQNNSRSRTPSQVIVKSAEDDGFVLDWLFGDTEFAEPAQGANPVVAAAARSLADLHLMIQLDGDGAYGGLANQEEVLARVQVAVDLIKKQVLDQVPAEQRAAVENSLKTALSPPVMLSGSTQEIQMFFDVHGAELDLNDPVEVEIQQVSPLTGQPIPATVRIALTKLSDASAEITIDTVFDSNVVREQTIQAMKQMAAGQPIPEDQIPAVKLGDRGIYTLDRATGLMQTVNMKRRVEVGPQVRNDEWQIRLLTAPKRP